MMFKADVMALLDVSDRTLEKLIAANKFPPSLRLGKHSRWTEAVVLRWLERRLQPQETWEPSKRAVRMPARSPGP
jgi:predicted DNA-binding transcriptional regulator AlpA